MTPRRSANPGGPSFMFTLAQLGGGETDGWTSSQISTVLNRLTGITTRLTDDALVQEGIGQSLDHLSGLLAWAIGLGCIWFGFVLGGYFVPSPQQMSFDSK